MSTDSAYRFAKALFGLDRGELDVVLDDLNQRYFQPIVQAAGKLIEEIASAPEISSYENLLIEKAGYGRLGARLMAHQICRSGSNQAAEIKEGRKVRASIDQMADAEGRSALVMSRRASRLRGQCRSLEASLPDRRGDQEGQFVADDSRIRQAR
jgi:hypothetical protein